MLDKEKPDIILKKKDSDMEKVLIFSAISLGVFLSIAIYSFNHKNEVEAETAISNGYEQCIEVTPGGAVHILWKRGCR